MHDDLLRQRSITAVQRARILDAMMNVVAEHGFAAATVKLVTQRAGVSSRTFYEYFENLADCFSAVLDLGLAQATKLIEDAFAREDHWEDGVRAALASVLAFFDSEPILAQVWFVESMAAGSNALEQREHIVGQLRAMIVDHWSQSAREPLEPLTVAGVMASVLGLIHSHLVNKKPPAMIELLGPLMGLITAPYLDRRGIARAVQRGSEAARMLAAENRSQVLGAATRSGTAPSQLAACYVYEFSRSVRLRECLFFVGEQPESSNREIAVGIGVKHQAQISKLLADLARKQLAIKRSEGYGKRNSWRLTTGGEAVLRTLTESRAHSLDTDNAWWKLVLDRRTLAARAQHPPSAIG